MGVICVLHGICVLHVAYVRLLCCLLLLAIRRSLLSWPPSSSTTSHSGAGLSPGGGSGLAESLPADGGVAASVPDAGVEIWNDLGPRFAPGSSAGWLVTSPDAVVVSVCSLRRPRPWQLKGRDGPWWRIAFKSGPAMLASMAFSLSDKDVGGRRAAAAGAGVGAAGPAAGHRLWLHGSARVHGSELPAPPAPRSKWRTGKTPVSCGLSASSAKVAGNDRGPDA